MSGKNFFFLLWIIFALVLLVLSRFVFSGANSPEIAEPAALSHPGQLQGYPRHSTSLSQKRVKQFQPAAFKDNAPTPFILKYRQYISQSIRQSGTQTERERNADA